MILLRFRMVHRRLNVIVNGGAEIDQNRRLCVAVGQEIDPEIDPEIETIGIPLQKGVRLNMNDVGLGANHFHQLIDVVEQDIVQCLAKIDANLYSIRLMLILLVHRQLNVVVSKGFDRSRQ